MTKLTKIAIFTKKILKVTNNSFFQKWSELLIFARKKNDKTQIIQKFFHNNFFFYILDQKF